MLQHHLGINSVHICREKDYTRAETKPLPVSNIRKIEKKKRKNRILSIEEQQVYKAKKKEMCKTVFEYFSGELLDNRFLESIQLQGAKPCDPTGGVVPGPCMCVFIETGISQSEVCSVTFS